ncbi:biotin--[acetyl-CoA-carboxylase] ligase [Paenibacillus contaminans]|uniref:Bifunctional ligase/repressor BirA n=1 Tax=Paenibacillus contaminans TaxID=450362 RepID=A0A329MEU3_9BACL|nr:biotin--[acetyl-CoA-carboxylase] ligase [Paenibacillus contaminans]RAV18491.1 biotin--[acetyl-CoA-carboxylase] ligase [Paenibacillus contaminans]
MNERLVQLFKQNQGVFLSGEQLSKELNCSRTAVWKHIQSLRKEGFEFEAVPKLGYRLLQVPERIDQASLLARLQTRTLGRTIKLYDEVDSTQNIAHELVRNGAGEGTLVIAEQQTKGRGRMGRNWLSPKGKGIWMSVVLKPEIPLPFTPQLTLLVAVALCRTIRKLTPEVGIKWPNDLLVRGKKISGILLESSAEDERLNYVIVGVGISANLKEEDYPDDLREKATSLLIERGEPIDRAALVCDFLLQLEDLYELYRDQGFAPIRTLWEALTVTLQRKVTIQTAQGIEEGTAVAIDDMGALLVAKPDGRTVTYFSGDVGQP